MILTYIFSTNCSFFQKRNSNLVGNINKSPEPCSADTLVLYAFVEPRQSIPNLAVKLERSWQTCWKSSRKNQLSARVILFSWTFFWFYAHFFSLKKKEQKHFFSVFFFSLKKNKSKKNFCIVFFLCLFQMKNFLEKTVFLRFFFASRFL